MVTGEFGCNLHNSCSDCVRGKNMYTTDRPTDEAIIWEMEKLDIHTYNDGFYI